MGLQMCCHTITIEITIAIEIEIEIDCDSDCARGNGVGAVREPPFRVRNAPQDHRPSPCRPASRKTSSCPCARGITLEGVVLLIYAMTYFIAAMHKAQIRLEADKSSIGIEIEIGIEID
jgi:hypothetical protein